MNDEEETKNQQHAKMANKDLQVLVDLVDSKISKRFEVKTQASDVLTSILDWNRNINLNRTNSNEARFLRSLTCVIKTTSSFTNSGVATTIMVLVQFALAFIDLQDPFMAKQKIPVSANGYIRLLAPHIEIAMCNLNHHGCKQWWLDQEIIDRIEVFVQTGLLNSQKLMPHIKFACPRTRNDLQMIVRTIELYLDQTYVRTLIPMPNKMPLHSNMPLLMYLKSKDVVSLLLPTKVDLQKVSIAHMITIIKDYGELKESDDALKKLYHWIIERELATFVIQDCVFESCADRIADRIAYTIDDLLEGRNPDSLNPVKEYVLSRFVDCQKCGIDMTGHAVYGTSAHLHNYCQECTKKYLRDAKDDAANPIHEYIATLKTLNLQDGTCWECKRYDSPDYVHECDCYDDGGEYLNVQNVAELYEQFMKVFIQPYGLWDSAMGRQNTKYRRFVAFLCAMKDIVLN